MTPKKRKYRNTPTVVDGVRFDSKGEARRWGELQLLVRSNRIWNLERQPRFPIVINGKPVCTYVGDFSYFEHTTGEKSVGSKRVIEDFKGCDTPLSKLKRKLVKAIYSIDVVIIK